MNQVYLAVLALITLFMPHAVLAQPYGGNGAEKPKGPMPFMAAMERHQMTIRVQKPGAEGQLVPVEAGVMVGVRVYRGGGAPKDYRAQTGDDGVAVVMGVPSNRMIQNMLKYEAFVDYEGVRYPYQLDGIPAEGALLDLKVEKVAAGSLDQVVAQHSIEVFADEDSMVARHIIRLSNQGTQTVNLGLLPGGGLVLPCPSGAKHPELHDKKNQLAEVRGTSIVFRGALLPVGAAPTTLNFVYTIPYKAETYEWTQTLPIRTTSVTVATPQYKQASQRVAVPMKLLKRGEQGEIDRVTQGPTKSWVVLKAQSLNLAADEPLRFAVAGLPVPSQLPNQLLIAAVILTILIVVFGYRRQEGDSGLRLSLSHLENERDRLVKVLARMRRARDKGKLSVARFEREQEAITARLVSVYRAIDRLKVS
jgi:hypothetical protein